MHCEHSWATWTDFKCIVHDLNKLHLFQMACANSEPNATISLKCSILSILHFSHIKCDKSWAKCNHFKCIMPILNLLQRIKWNAHGLNQLQLFQNKCTSLEPNATISRGTGLFGADFNYFKQIANILESSEPISRESCLLLANHSYLKWNANKMEYSESKCNYFNVMLAFGVVNFTMQHCNPEKTYTDFKADKKRKFP